MSFFDLFGNSNKKRDDFIAATLAICIAFASDQLKANPLNGVITDEKDRKRLQMTLSVYGIMYALFMILSMKGRKDCEAARDEFISLLSQFFGKQKKSVIYYSVYRDEIEFIGTEMHERDLFQLANIHSNNHLIVGMIFNYRMQHLWGEIISMYTGIVDGNNSAVASSQHKIASLLGKYYCGDDMKYHSQFSLACPDIGHEIIKSFEKNFW